MSKSRMMKKNDSNIVDVSVVITVRMSGNSSENQRFSCFQYNQRKDKRLVK